VEGLAVVVHLVPDDVDVHVGVLGGHPARGRAAEHQADDRGVVARDDLVQRCPGGVAQHGSDSTE
jgi:hypothetical protein